MDSIANNKHNDDLWSLLNEIADITNNMEETVSLLQDVQEYLSDAFDELASQIADYDEELKNCNSRLFEINHHKSPSGTEENDDILF